MKNCIIIPTLCERDNIAKLIPAILGFIPEADILVVDDDSRDGTDKIVQQFSRAKILIRTQDHGYGSSVLDGFRWALERDFDRIVTMDADFSHDPAVLPALIAKLDGCDVAIGSRYISGGGIANWHWQRRILSMFANWYVRAILRTGIADNTTGFVAYRRNALAKLVESDIVVDGYAFLVAGKYVLAKTGFRIAEQPIIYTERREGESKMSFKNIWESIWLPWRLRFAKLRK